ncbi:MAG: TIGR00180 family glycosyltransferase [Flavisolibacter sp.]
MPGLSEISLIIPTHNRHGYLRRILDYYATIKIGIVIVDSSEEAFKGHFDGTTIVYNHYPNMSLPQKLRHALNQVKTRFVAMCADDDFIIPEGMEACLKFLNHNKSFVVAQGNNVMYRKQRDYASAIEINPMYLQQLDFEITYQDPLERLNKLFHPYRTIFSAVQYSSVLRKAFENLDPQIKNLYLNEYLTAVIPILSGCYKELNIFYQVREFSLTSDDKTTDNLDVIYTSDNYGIEFSVYLDYLARRAFEITGLEYGYCRRKIQETFLSFSKQIVIDKRNMQNPNLVKRIGTLIDKVPIYGSRIVLYRRLRQQQRSLVPIIKTSEDVRQLDRVKKFIRDYASIVG